MTNESPSPSARPAWHRVSGDPMNTNSSILAEVRFTDAGPEIRVDNGTVIVNVPAQGNDLVELWCVEKDQVIVGKSDRVHWAHSAEDLFAAVTVPDSDELTSGVRSAYALLLETAEALGFPQVYRVWNFMGAINEPNGSGLERYQDFCRGRAQAFDDLAWNPTALPAGTGIGVHTGGVVVFLLACRSRALTNIENPRQLSAYAYPEQYGPRSPSFARATVVGIPGGRTVYLSGTASIVGHETIGVDLEEQLSVTGANIDALLLASGLIEPRVESLKIYVRHVQDVGRTLDYFHQRYLLDSRQVSALVADICRSNLLLEVEAIAREVSSSE